MNIRGPRFTGSLVKSSSAWAQVVFSPRRAKNLPAGPAGRLLGAGGSLAAPGLFSKSAAQGRGTGSITSISSGRLGRTRSCKGPPESIPLRGLFITWRGMRPRAGLASVRPNLLGLASGAWDSPGKERLGVRRMLVGLKFLPGEDSTSHPTYLL